MVPLADDKKEEEKGFVKRTKPNSKEPVISLLGEETKFSLLAVPAATKTSWWSLSWFGQTEERCVLGGQKKLGAEGEKFLLYESRRTKVPWYWIGALGERTWTWTMLRSSRVSYDIIIRTRVYSNPSLSPCQYLLPALNGFPSERHPVACRPGPRSRHVSACQWGEAGQFGGICRCRAGLNRFTMF